MKGGCYPGVRAVLVGGRDHRAPGALDRRARRGPPSPATSKAAAAWSRPRWRSTRTSAPRVARLLVRAAIGAYYSTDRPTIPLTIGLACLVNTYGIPAVHARVTAALTNTMTIAPYRGGSRPEPIYVTENHHRQRRRANSASRPAESRRRNTIPASAMHTYDGLQQTHDLGDFVKNLDDCLVSSPAIATDRRGARLPESAAGRWGSGSATACAATGGRDYEHAEIRFDPAGGVVLMTGSMDHGYSATARPSSRSCPEKLGIDADLIRYHCGDSDLRDDKHRHLRFAPAAARRPRRTSPPRTD